MSRAKRHSQESCSSCDRPFYSKGLCKRCYMADYRGKPVSEMRVPKPSNEIDPEAFWQFVKKELNIG